MSNQNIIHYSFNGKLCLHFKLTSILWSTAADRLECQSRTYKEKEDTLHFSLAFASVLGIPTAQNRNSFFFSL